MEFINGIVLVALCSMALSLLVVAVVLVLYYKEHKKTKALNSQLDDAIQVRERIVVKPVSRVG